MFGDCCFGGSLNENAVCFFFLLWANRISGILVEIKLRRLLESRLQIFERTMILKINGDIFFFL